MFFSRWSVLIFLSIWKQSEQNERMKRSLLNTFRLTSVMWLTCDVSYFSFEHPTPPLPTPPDIYRFRDFTPAMVTLRSSALSSFVHFTRTSLIFHGNLSSSVPCTGTKSSGSTICWFPNEHLLVLQHMRCFACSQNCFLFWNARTWNQFSALNPFFPPGTFSVFYLRRGYSFWNQRNFIGQTIHVNTTYKSAELLVLAWLF